MWKRLTRYVMTAPSAHTINIGHNVLPHCVMSVEKNSGAINNIVQIAKFDGFQRCRPFHRITYFDVMAIALVSANGQKRGVRHRMPTLMPVMYALARIGNL